MSAAPVRFRLATAAERAAIFGVVPPMSPSPVTVPRPVTPMRSGDKEEIDGSATSRSRLGNARASRPRTRKEASSTR